VLALCSNMEIDRNGFVVALSSSVELMLRFPKPRVKLSRRRKCDGGDYDAGKWLCLLPTPSGGNVWDRSIR